MPMLRDPLSATRDPVCGAPVDQESAPNVMISGTKYYFCGESCRKTFLSQPEDAPHHEDYDGP